MQIEINSKILGTFVLGAAIAGASVYFAAVRPLQAQIAKDQSAIADMKASDNIMLSQLQTFEARIVEQQRELNARAPQPVANAAAGQGIPTVGGQGMTGYDALNVVRPGLGTVLQKAAPVINRAVQQWQASHQTTYTPPATPAIDCTGLDTASNQRALTASETRDYQQCFGRMPRFSETNRSEQPHPTGDPGCSVVSAMVNNGEALSDVERAEYNRCTLQ